MSFRFLGTGSCVPDLVVTNDDLSQFLDTSDEWITQRVGVRERRLCVTETAESLGVEACKRALENAGTAPEELDLILCSTVSADHICPPAAAFIQREIGATCPAFDINGACPGFLVLMETAAAFFARSGYQKILLVSAERMSRLADWTDRSTCVIFGDGAGAAVQEKGDGFLSSVMHTVGNDEVLRIEQQPGNSPYYVEKERNPYLQMNGQETYKFAVKSLRHDLVQVIEEAGLQQSQIDHVVAHQANYRILNDALRKLEIPNERFHMNIDRYGNTSSASVPILLDELNRAGQLERGQYVAFCAFGGGLSSAASVVRW